MTLDVWSPSQSLHLAAVSAFHFLHCDSPASGPLHMQFSLLEMHHALFLLHHPAPPPSVQDLALASFPWKAFPNEVRSSFCITKGTAHWFCWAHL